MSARVKYVGRSQARVINAADFTAAGLVYGTSTWDDNNDFEKLVPDDIALFLLSLAAEFQTVSGQDFGDLLASGLGMRCLGEKVKTDGVITSTAGPITPIPGMDKEVLVGELPILIEARVYMYGQNPSTFAGLVINEDGVAFDTGLGGTAAIANQIVPCSGFTALRTPAPGLHTYSFSIDQAGAAGNASCTSGISIPMLLRVWETTLAA